jgi:hypothetical protein
MIKPMKTLSHDTLQPSYFLEKFLKMKEIKDLEASHGSVCLQIQYGGQYS